MTGVTNLVERLVSLADNDRTSHVSSIVLLAAIVCLIWYLVVSVVCIVGFSQL